MTVLGLMSPDRVASLLGTGYSRFESPTGMNGLAKVHGDRLDLLALDATIPGTGQLRVFMDQCKREFETICVWEVWTPWLHGVLQRYGFRAYAENDRDTGERVVGYRFDGGRVKEQQ